MKMLSDHASTIKVQQILNFSDSSSQFFGQFFSQFFNFIKFKKQLVIYSSFDHFMHIVSFIMQPFFQKQAELEYNVVRIHHASKNGLV